MPSFLPFPSVSAFFFAFLLPIPLFLSSFSVPQPKPGALSYTMALFPDSQPRCAFRGLDNSVGLRTINERIHQIEPLLGQAQSEPITEVPPVVQFDGIWLRVQSQTDTIKLDKRQRQRHQRTGKKVVLLVALGFWTDGSGKREILDWQVATSEGKAAWETLVNRLWERGVRPENGLQAVIRDGCGELGEALAFVYGSTVVEQRCIFHKMRNVADKCREELKGDKEATPGAGERHLSS